MRKLDSRRIHLVIGANGYSQKYLCALTDFVFLNIAFFMVQYIRVGSLGISRGYFKLLICFYVAWLITSLITGKFRQGDLKRKDCVFLQLKSILLLVYLISFVVVILGIKSYSRVQIFGTCLVMLILALPFFSVVHLRKVKERSSSEPGREGRSPLRSRIPVSLIVSDFVLLNAAFFAMNLFKRGTLTLLPHYEEILLIIYGLWMIASLLTKKYGVHHFYNMYYELPAGIT